MNPETIRGFAQSILDELGPAPIVVPTTPSPVITTPDAFDRALSLASPGDTLLLGSTFVYPAPLTLRKPVTLRGIVSLDNSARMTKDFALPKFLGGLTAPADNVALHGIDVRHTNPLMAILTMSGLNPIIHQVRVLGDPVNGAHRGIAYSGTAGQILGCYVDDIFQPAQDTQAIYSQDMGPGLIIDNCTLMAAGQSLMFGGGDPTSEARIPRQITLTNSLLTKKREWLDVISGGFATGNAKHRQQVKCALELKNVVDFTALNCDLEYAGTSEGQGAFGVVLTPRNQGNTAPYTTVERVIITKCRIRHVGGGVTMLGDDNVHPSKRMTDVLLQNLTVEDIDASLYGGSGRLFYINRAPVGVTIDGITASGKLKSVVYFDEKVPPTRLTIKNLKVPTGIPYAYHNMLGDTLASLQKFAPDAVLQVTAADTGAV